MRELQAAILAEARLITNKRKLTHKDISEWSSGEIKTVPKDEKVFFLPSIKIYVAILVSAL